MPFPMGFLVGHQGPDSWPPRPHPCPQHEEGYSSSGRVPELDLLTILHSGEAGALGPLSSLQAPRCRVAYPSFLGNHQGANHIRLLVVLLGSPFLHSLICICPFFHQVL